ncbi:hypothetical protein AAMO2058_000947600 [Amorphochlora amoebiformis]
MLLFFNQCSYSSTRGRNRRSQLGGEKNISFRVHTKTKLPRAVSQAGQRCLLLSRFHSAYHQAVVNSIFEKGVNAGTIRVLNYVIVALIASIFLAIFTGSGNVHVYILLVLSLGLLFSVNYYFSILGMVDVKGNAKEEEKVKPVRRKRRTSKKAD